MHDILISTGVVISRTHEWSRTTLKQTCAAKKLQYLEDGWI